VSLPLTVRTTSPLRSEADTATITCTCGAAATYDVTSGKADRGRWLVRLDRAVAQGQVTRAEAAERRVELLSR
jgi:hypothetical protein